LKDSLSFNIGGNVWQTQRNFAHYTIESSLRDWLKTRRQLVELSSLIPQRKSHNVVGFWRLERARLVKTEQFVPLDLKSGDTVLFGKYAGTEVKIGTEDRLIMREDDVLAVIE
jgi:hypothetical protein